MLKKGLLIERVGCMEEINIELQKANLLTEYKDVIANNIESVGYAIFNILCSDKSLEKCEYYDSIVGLDKQCPKSHYDEKYILYSLLSIMNKVPMSFDKKEESNAKIKSYSKYFDNMKRAS